MKENNHHTSSSYLKNEEDGQNLLRMLHMNQGEYKRENERMFLEPISFQ